jgi:hypothetical protein
LYEVRAAIEQVRAPPVGVGAGGAHGEEHRHEGRRTIDHGGVDDLPLA